MEVLGEVRDDAAWRELKSVGDSGIVGEVGSG